jgi:hypothetical protein
MGRVAWREHTPPFVGGGRNDLVPTPTIDAAGCKSVKNFAAPGRQISLRSYSWQYQDGTKDLPMNTLYTMNDEWDRTVRRL